MRPRPVGAVQHGRPCAGSCVASRGCRKTVQLLDNSAPSAHGGDLKAAMPQLRRCSATEA